MVAGRQLRELKDTEDRLDAELLWYRCVPRVLEAHSYHEVCEATAEMVTVERDALTTTAREGAMRLAAEFETPLERLFLFPMECIFLVPLTVLRCLCDIVTEFGQVMLRGESDTSKRHAMGAALEQRLRAANPQSAYLIQRFWRRLGVEVPSLWTMALAVTKVAMRAAEAALRVVAEGRRHPPRPTPPAAPHHRSRRRPERCTRPPGLDRPAASPLKATAPPRPSSARSSCQHHRVLTTTY